MNYWYIGNCYVEFSYTRFCWGAVLDDSYWAVYAGPMSFVWQRKIRVKVRG